MALVESLDDAALGNVGVANNNPVTARAICWIIAGHAQHHLGILRERYRRLSRQVVLAGCVTPVYSCCVAGVAA